MGNRLLGATFGDTCHLCGALLLNAVNLEGAPICHTCLRRIDATPLLKRRILLGNTLG